MKIRINYDHNEDFDWECVNVYDADNKLIAGVSTSADCPEDNNVSRLNIAGEFERLAKALGAEVEHTQESENE